MTKYGIFNNISYDLMQGGNLYEINFEKVKLSYMDGSLTMCKDKHLNMLIGSSIHDGCGVSSDVFYLSEKIFKYYFSLMPLLLKLIPWYKFYVWLRSHLSYSTNFLLKFLIADSHMLIQNIFIILSTFMLFVF